MCGDILQYCNRLMLSHILKKDVCFCSTECNCPLFWVLQPLGIIDISKANFVPMFHLLNLRFVFPWKLLFLDLQDTHGSLSNSFVPWRIGLPIQALHPVLFSSPVLSFVFEEGFTVSYLFSGNYFMRVSFCLCGDDIEIQI